MDVRAQTAMVFHLDKCIGCHTCSIVCKNIWTDRPGAEYMWWNNVETKPGTGYPTQWEDQVNYNGGWVVDGDGQLVLRSQRSKAKAYLNLFYNPNQPGLDDYYEPWTYKYEDLINAPEGDDQPTARPVSSVTGEIMEKIESGPNWDDDLSGSPLYAENDPNLKCLTEDERKMLFEVRQLCMMYLPRICNHCANPACVAACPSGALYKRGEDGIVLVNQDVCRGWRSCVAACPYKKMYYNWRTGKSEKCILCYPRLETGQPSACFHSCVGRIRYQGVLLYDADRVEQAMKAPNESLVEAQLGVILDPNDPAVIEGAKRNGMNPLMIDAARQSPVWKYVKEWGLALPLHPEFRTLPMLYYVPPLLPVMGRAGSGLYSHEDPESFFAQIDNARMPLKFLAALLSAGNVDVLRGVMRKMLAVRYYMRAKSLDDVNAALVKKVLSEAKLNGEDAEAIYKLTSISGVNERYVLPPIQREESVEAQCGSVAACKGCSGFDKFKSLVKGT